MLKQYAGIDVQKWFPNAKSTPEASKDWTYETQLKAAEACHKAGFTFGLGCGSGSTDARQTWGATFGAFGAHLLDAKGNITVDTDTVREAMDYCKRLIPFIPADTVQYDDASNNRALISGKSALIWNPPSAWAVAKRDAPQVARGLLDVFQSAWTEGPHGATPAVFLGDLEFLQGHRCRQGHSAVPLATRAGREHGRRRRRL